MSASSRAGQCPGKRATNRPPAVAPQTASARVRHALRLSAIAMTAATLAACAQSPGRSERAASLAATRQVPTDTSAGAATVNERLTVAAIAKNPDPVAPPRPPADIKNASYGL